MDDILISGGRALFGEIEPSGSKNAALPIIFATVITRGISEISGVPDIGDVRVALRTIEDLGAAVTRFGDTVTVDTRTLSYKRPNRALTSKIRASSYLIGACISRFGIFHLSEFGGCNFCNRPIDLHLYAAEALGAVADGETVYANRLIGARINFEKRSVGATINALIMAVAARGETFLSGVAKEPHVRALAEFLVSCGAVIEETDSGFYVRGAELHGGRIRVIPDMIEAGTYLLLGPLTEGSVTVKRSNELELDSFLGPLSDSGVQVSVGSDSITLSGVPTSPINIATAPHPGYPTDLQPQMAPLMARYFGGAILENVWQNRFSYLDSLKPFGLKYCINSSSAVIYPSSLSCAETEATDLRGGAAAIMCALASKGESKIKNSGLVHRGYERLCEKLLTLGAEIKKEPTLPSA